MTKCEGYSLLNVTTYILVFCYRRFRRAC